MTDLRIIPSIERLRQGEACRALEREFGRGAIVRALREAADRLRAALVEASGPAAAAPGVADAESAAAWIEEQAAHLLRHAGHPSLMPVVNATGVILHTNLGRAPLADAALRRIADVAPGFSNLEYDIARGCRGHRDGHAEALLCRLLGTEAAVVVNNNAAATLLLLAALAGGREVVVSRGELVEIGGGFRVPDVMAQSGARLREVGTTNRTRAEDYRDAVGPDTALLLRVHRSNFRIEGFTAQPTLAELAEVGHERGVVVAEDIGSGFIGLGDEPGADRLDAALAGEPRVQDSVAAGIDIVCFSGDKLLGGPQAGIIAGRSELVARVRRHPLMRALRVCKLTYAALEATLGEYAAGRARETVPIVRMLLAPVDEIDARARALAGRVEALRASAGQGAGTAATDLHLDIVDGLSAIGGGSAPGVMLPTRLLALRQEGRSADSLDARLRRHDPPVVARIVEGTVVLDLRTVLPEQDAVVAEAVAAAAAR